jgi:hypothetical protein
MPGGRQFQPVVDRFIGKCGTRDENGCIPWLAKRDQYEYGVFWFEGKQRRASRVAYQLFAGPITDTELCLHHCDHPWCVNPEHLICSSATMRRTNGSGDCVTVVIAGVVVIANTCANGTAQEQVANIVSAPENAGASVVWPFARLGARESPHDPAPASESHGSRP